MKPGFMDKALLVGLTALMTGCGNWLVDDSIVKQAEAKAARPGTSSREQGEIYESAGDASVRNGQLGFAADMYFNAANSFNAADLRRDVARVFEKCYPASQVSCRSIQELIIDEWHGTAVASQGEPPRNRLDDVVMPPTISFPGSAGTPPVAVRGAQLPAQVSSSRQTTQVAGAPDRRKPPVACMVLRDSQARAGYVEFFNSCSFPVTYSFCTEKSGSPYDCRGERTGRGTDNLRAGATSEHFPAARMNWVACKGGPEDGVLAILDRGQARCE